MSLEKNIRGKRDSHHHDRLYSNRKREQEAENRLSDGLLAEQIQASLMMYEQRDKLPEYMITWHIAFLKEQGLI